MEWNILRLTKYGKIETKEKIMVGEVSKDRQAIIHIVKVVSLIPVLNVE